MNQSAFGLCDKGPVRPAGAVYRIFHRVPPCTVGRRTLCLCFSRHRAKAHHKHQQHSAHAFAFSSLQHHLPFFLFTSRQRGQAPAHPHYSIHSSKKNAGKQPVTQTTLKAVPRAIFGIRHSFLHGQKARGDLPCLSYAGELQPVRAGV